MKKAARMTSINRIELSKNNISIISIDTETTGLNPSQNELRIITVKLGDEAFYFKPNDLKSVNWMRDICENENIIKVFHYAAFDISFLHQIDVVEHNSVWCTKVAEKILTPKGNFSLKNLIHKYNDTRIEKGLQLSNWSKELSQAQEEYLGNDVWYLESIMKKQVDLLQVSNLYEAARKAMQAIPVVGYLRFKNIDIDVFSY